MSDNIYSVYDNQRISIDTLFFGLDVDNIYGYDEFEKIKDYLSFNNIHLYDNNSGNCYYHHQERDEENGVVIMVEPRENCKNDFITIQLTGKFFREINNSIDVLDWFFSEYQGRINLQRCDLAVDILFKQYPVWLIEDSRVKMHGFPLPHYNVNYKYKKMGFEFYGRTGAEFTNYSFINMVSCGHGDIRLRVYDKTLDLYEKYNMEYGQYYSIEDVFEQVYRIELQCRGKQFKAFLDNLVKKYGFIDRSCLQNELLIYLVNKFSFDFVNPTALIANFGKPLRFSDGSRKSTLINQYKYHRARQNSEYQQCCKLADKIIAKRKLEEGLYYACKVGKDNLFDLQSAYEEFEKMCLDTYRSDMQNKNLNGGVD